MDSDINNADAKLTVEFYENKQEGKLKGVPFVRIFIPADQSLVHDQPVREIDKKRFPREWLNFQMSNSSAEEIGIPLSKWLENKPEDISSFQVSELQILNFRTVEQVAMASDAQIQKIGMGAMGLREKARNYVNNVNNSQNSKELQSAKDEIEQLKSQMKELISQKKVGRPRKEEVNVKYDVGTSHAGGE